MIWVIVISLGIQAIFYLLIFSRLAMYSEKHTSADTQKTSILICYKNEEDKIEKTLPSILEQAFAELLLVDDKSTDRTLEILKRYATEKIKVIPISETSKGKKQALFNGILLADNESIVLTDADCIPASKNWSLCLNSHSTPFVLGYGPMKRVKGLVGLFSRFETYMTALQYLSYALIGIPYMGVGRNMKIDKSIIQSNIDKIQGSHLASGDDDLMVNALCTKENTSICIDPESFVYSDPKTTLSSFLKQKTRHISTSPFYKPIHKILLSVFSFSHILFYLALISSVIFGTINIKLGVVFLLAKWTIQQSVNYVTMKKLKEDDLFLKFPVLDILFFVYLLLMPFYYLFNKKNSTWS